MLPLHLQSKTFVLDPRLERVEKDFESRLKSETVVVTGDIAYSGVKEEYEVAKKF